MRWPLDEHLGSIHAVTSVGRLLSQRLHSERRQMPGTTRRSVVALFAVFLPCAATAQLADSVAVDRYVRAEMDRQHIIGLAVAVVKSGRVAHARGFGFADRDRQILATPTTVFKIGSVSKQFLATGIMLLVQDGRVNVNDPVKKYLQDAPNSWRPIMIHNLLEHTSGILREGPAFNPNIRQPDINVIRSAYSARLEFGPGTQFQYCNVCYFALAEVIARVSGKPWDVFMRERVFAPAGMIATATTSDSIANRARGYDWRDDAHHVVPDWPALRPSGAFVSTVLDLARWDSVLYTGTILTRASRDRMWTQTPLPHSRESEYGFGWFVEDVRCNTGRSADESCRVLQGRRIVHHSGALPGFRATFTHIPRDSLTVIVLTNTDGADPAGIARGVASLVLRRR